MTRREHDSRVRPGLTGLVQVSGNSRLTWNEQFVLDAWYQKFARGCLTCAFFWRRRLQFSAVNRNATTRWGSVAS